MPSSDKHSEANKMSRQKIQKILISRDPENEESYVSNYDTDIRFEERNGLHCSLPYLAVYKRHHAEAEWQKVAEFCQHNIIGVYYWMEPMERSNVS